MNKLVKVTTSENGEQLVSARELHKYLDVKKKFSSWWEQYENMFVDNEDYTRVPQSYLVESGNGANRLYDDLALKLDIAKHISMLTKTPKGEEARNYFIKLEKMWNSPEMVIQRAMQFQQQKIDSLQQQNAELMSRLSYTQETLDLDTKLYTTSEIAIEFGFFGANGTHKFYEVLNRLKIVYPRKKKNHGFDWVLYANHQNKGYRDDRIKRTSQKWTVKGRDFLVEKVANSDAFKTIERRG